MRVAPGVVPGVDISPFNLHSVRETALGGFFDFQNGNQDRANAAIREVLSHQYLDVDTPWFGTFRVTAEQADPPWPGAVEWSHYDPNWRQFLGCILALVQLVFADELDDDVSVGIDLALERCVRGEVPGRIPDWYTNPNLMHAWLVSHVASRSGESELADRGADLREMLLQRFRRFGDLDEYNSPTYDGIDFFALLLWVVHPPQSEFETAGLELVSALVLRMSALFSPTLSVPCGPYIRSYGLRLTDYVSLLGIWINIFEEDCDVLPTSLDLDTVHVHDLFFAPVFRYLSSCRPEIAMSLVESDIIWVQDFEGTHSTSVRTAARCVGVESGRRHDFARDQYAPAVLHWRDEGVGVASVAVLCGATSYVDAEVDASVIFGVNGSVIGSGAGCDVRLMYVKGIEASVSGGRYSLGEVDILFNDEPLSSELEEKGAYIVKTLTFGKDQVQFRIQAG